MAALTILPASTSAGTITVAKEDATVTFDDGNPPALQVSAPGGRLDAGELTLVVKVKEKEFIFSGNHNLKIINNKDHEDKQTFKQRTKIFQYTIIPYIIQALKKKLQLSNDTVNISKRKLNKLGKTLIRLEKDYEKLKKKLNN